MRSLHRQKDLQQQQQQKKVYKKSVKHKNRKYRIFVCKMNLKKRKKSNLLTK